jgi:hypothetical protein
MARVARRLDRNTAPIEPGRQLAPRFECVENLVDFLGETGVERHEFNLLRGAAP